jgi:lipid-binding SYLF domain-containing protein
MRHGVSLAVAVFLFLSFASRAVAQDKWENLLIESAKVFEEMTEMPEEGIPSSLIKKCHAVAIFPSTVGGGFIIGGKYGQGVIVGWQIGGQATDIILLVMTERGLDGLLQSKFKLGGDASVSAGPVGRDAQAATDLQLKGGILSYSRSRGLFAGIKLEGAIITFNRKANTSLYGGKASSRDILIERTVDVPDYAKRLMKNLRKY